MFKQVEGTAVVSISHIKKWSQHAAILADDVVCLSKTNTVSRPCTSRWLGARMIFENSALQSDNLVLDNERNRSAVYPDDANK